MVRSLSVLFTIVPIWAAAGQVVPDSGAMRRASRDSARSQLQRLYEENRQAYLRKDLQAIMALRAEDFHTVTPDGATRNRASMEQYIVGLLIGIQSWNELTVSIDSLNIHGDTARVIASQYLDRRALRPDNEYHRVQTWATQREVWLRTASGWRMWRVDSIRNQRRLVDGREPPVRR
jgi:ketosteroid isomerase-like protein